MKRKRRYNLNSQIFGEEMKNLFSRILKLGEVAYGQFLPICPSIGTYPESCDLCDEKGIILGDIALVTRWGREYEEREKIELFHNTHLKGFISSPYWDLLAEIQRDGKITIFSSSLPLFLEIEIRKAIFLLETWQEKNTSMTLQDIIDIFSAN